MRNVSDELLEALYAQQTSEVFLLLITIDHTELAQPIRVVNNTEEIVSNSETYIGFPCEIVLPSETEDSPPRATISIDNVDRQISETIRAISSPPTITFQIIRAADPDTVEIEWPAFILRNVQYDSQTVSGELELENLVAEPYPAGAFTPAAFPGLF